jgi:hypothetical protein
VSLDKSPDGYRSIRYWPLAGAPLIYGGNKALLCIELQRAPLAARGRATNLFYTFHVFYVDVNDATHYNIVIGEGKEAPMTDEQKTLVLEVVQQAIDGLIYDGEMVEKIEKVTGGKIERLA